MSTGANSIHRKMRTELENYIKSQYFGKSPLLLNAISDLLDNEGLLYQKPYIESAPAYKTKPYGIEQSDIPQWMKKFFLEMANAELGVYAVPFEHQVTALEQAVKGKDLFVSTGTGSGKTECFIWPILAKLANEAYSSKSTWQNRGIRTIIMYPMNALVSDQISRLRRMIGDPENKFINIFRNTCGHDVRRPQFGMYTGRTPYPGNKPDKKEDHQLENTLARMTYPQANSEQDFFKRLAEEGKIPAKSDMKAFLERIHNGIHIPDNEDAELITRFEMQQFCPDILITNYSMLEYMLIRPKEAKIWNETKQWLKSDKNNKLLFVIDEAHMYSGSSGGEVALLIRRLFHKLEISRDNVQFILTTASMPDSSNEDRAKVMTFACELTSEKSFESFSYIRGKHENIDDSVLYNIPIEKFLSYDTGLFEKESSVLDTLNDFWRDIEGNSCPFDSAEAAYEWMYDNLIKYAPFHTLIKQCRGTAVSLQELACTIFPDADNEQALNAVSVLLAITPLAKNKKKSVLFPARMHMLFRGIKGVYACANENCPHSHSDGELTLGEIFLSDGKLVCPHCNSVVYELYNDRRCGALFYKGYIMKSAIEKKGNGYLWHYPGEMMENQLMEIHLFISPSRYIVPKSQSKYPIKPCYLDVKSGFINFRDDSDANKPYIRKLYYCDFPAAAKPKVITFHTCPHCRHLLSRAQLTSFSTKGNLSFYNLIKCQFESQPAVPGKDCDPLHIPNEGRKVLLFSDSRQRAARLAKDMSDASGLTVARQLLALAIQNMEKSNASSMNEIYDYICIAAAQRHIQIFHDEEGDKFIQNCETAITNYNRSNKRGQGYSPRFTMSNAPFKVQEYLLQLYNGAYNTFYDYAISWIEPTNDALWNSIDALEEKGISVSEEVFLEIFNAWMLYISDTFTALGHTISDEIRTHVRHSYGGYGLGKDWSFSKTIKDILMWKNDSKEMEAWINVLTAQFLSDLNGNEKNGKLYVDLARIRPRFDKNHIWFRCDKCSELTPYKLKEHCPRCGSQNIHTMNSQDENSLIIWRKPIEDALNGGKIRFIDTEEHTAQLSYNDQRDNMWSKTEQYELRFKDLVQKNEYPVDILSSTTTMEVGIDIGSLVAVGLRNIPPMRENYQQRAGRAGRRGSSLSTIVTFCEDGPHDSLYFNNPVPMLRGEPRKPWIDVKSEKLLCRHLNMIVLQEYLASVKSSLDTVPAAEFLDSLLESFHKFLSTYKLPVNNCLLSNSSDINISVFKNDLSAKLELLNQKRFLHPELYGVSESGELNSNAKVLLDALYEEGIIPTYSFPKNVVSTYISDHNGKLKYQVQRALDIAIGEYAPGRSIVVDKETYQLGGFYYPGSEWKKGRLDSPARSFIEDPNYVKNILTCTECGWFGLLEEKTSSCPFCGNKALVLSRKMLRPWGFAPRNAESILDAQLIEEYSAVQQPLYSTLPEADEMFAVENCQNIRIASRNNQRIIMLNKGSNDNGFMVCKDCGAAFPGNEQDVLKELSRPYKSRFLHSQCKHTNTENINLGYDFVTDMLVLEFSLDAHKINTNRKNNPWLDRAAQSLAEALRLTASQELDIEFTELVTGYRFRNNFMGFFVDIYLYDSLSSGAGYSIEIADKINLLIDKSEKLLEGCNCDGACYNCLKHYKNHFCHGKLDRFAALDLLHWGTKGAIPKAISANIQQDYIKPLVSIIEKSGRSLSLSKMGIFLKTKENTKQLIVYPAMWNKPYEKGKIFISDACIKYARPYAVEKIIEEAESDVPEIFVQEVFAGN